MRLSIVWLFLYLGLIGSLSASEEADVENELSALRETLKNIETTWRASGAFQGRCGGFAPGHRAPQNPATGS